MLHHSCPNLDWTLSPELLQQLARALAEGRVDLRRFLAQSNEEAVLAVGKGRFGSFSAQYRLPPRGVLRERIQATYHNGACGFAFADGHAQIKKWTGQLAGPDWAIPVYKDRHAGVLKCTAALDKIDIDWVKDRMADPK